MRTGVPAAAMVTPSSTIAFFRCALTISLAFEVDEEIVPSSTTSSVDPMGNSFAGGGGVGVGVPFGCGVVIGIAPSGARIGEAAASAKLAAIR